MRCRSRSMHTQRTIQMHALHGTFHLGILSKLQELVSNSSAEENEKRMQISICLVLLVNSIFIMDESLTILLGRARSRKCMPAWCKRVLQIKDFVEQFCSLTGRWSRHLKWSAIYNMFIEKIETPYPEGFYDWETKQSEDLQYCRRVPFPVWYFLC